jgi:hypothetical protein
MRRRKVEGNKRMSGSLPPSRRRVGCLPGLAVLFVLGLVGMAVIGTIMGPWILTVGGRQRLLPIWEGVGDAQGPGGTYRLYIWFSPNRSFQRTLPEAAVQGYSVLCTPRGEQFNLKLYGGAPGRLWLRMDEGHAFNLRVFRRPRFALSINSVVAPPRLQFAGRWRGADLVMDDQGSFNRAFNPDGTLNPNPGDRYSETRGIPITFSEHFWGLISSPACLQPPAR